MRPSPSLRAVLTDCGGLVSLRRHPALRSVVTRRVAAGELTWLLPRVAALDATPARRMMAVPMWNPDAVLVGDAAARLGIDRSRPVGEVGVASSRAGSPRPGYVMATRSLDPSHVESAPLRSGELLRWTTPALTAVDALACDGGALLCDGVRRGLFTVAHAADLMGELPRRRGDRVRRELLAAARGEPWSVLELELHRLLRAGGLTGWTANQRVFLDDLQAVVAIDVAFERQRVAVEADGLSVHGSAAALGSDLVRQNALVCAGWSVLRYTWQHVTERGDWVVDQIARELATATLRADRVSRRRHRPRTTRIRR